MGKVVCAGCGDSIIPSHKRMFCPTCQDKMRIKKNQERAVRRYAKRKEAAAAASSQGGNAHN